MKDIAGLTKKTFFTIEDVVNLYGYDYDSARVFISRYIARGIFVKFRKGLYTTMIKWESFELPDFFKISNYLKVPSYISLLSALSYYSITTQVQQSVFDSITVKISKRWTINSIEFKFYKVKDSLFEGYQKINQIFIAIPEKAIFDIFYLYSFGKYAFDKDAIDFGKFDKSKFNFFYNKAPDKTKASIDKLWKI